MKKYILSGVVAVSVSGIFSGCLDAVGLGMKMEDMDYVMIYNNIDVSTCGEYMIPEAYKKSFIDYHTHTKQCDKYGKVEGEDCSVSDFGYDGNGDITCVIGYDRD